MKTCSRIVSWGFGAAFEKLRPVIAAPRWLSLSLILHASLAASSDPSVAGSVTLFAPVTPRLGPKRRPRDILCYSLAFLDTTRSVASPCSPTTVANQQSRMCHPSPPSWTYRTNQAQRIQLKCVIPKCARVTRVRSGSVRVQMIRNVTAVFRYKRTSF